MDFDNNLSLPIFSTSLYTDKFCITYVDTCYIATERFSNHLEWLLNNDKYMDEICGTRGVLIAR